MKLVVEIEDDVYDLIKHSDATFNELNRPLHDAIRNGTPINFFLNDIKEKLGNYRDMFLAYQKLEYGSIVQNCLGIVDKYTYHAPIDAER